MRLKANSYITLIQTCAACGPRAVEGYHIIAE